MKKKMATIQTGSLPWKRSPGPPRVWKRFEINGKTENGRKDETILKFSIEEIPAERHDEVLDIMVNHYLEDEPLSRCVNIKDDPVGIEEHRNVCRLYLSQGISVALFLDDPNVDKREIAGINVLRVMTRGDIGLFNNFNQKSVGYRKIREFIIGAKAGINAFERYKVDKYLSEFGLLVLPRFRGYSLGGHLLGVRNNIGQEYNIPVTETVFTTSASQTLALRNGFEILVEKKYSEAYDKNGQLLFPNINAEYMKIMGKRLR